MTAITWSEALALKQPRMDQTHREFVDLMQQLQARIDAGEADLAPSLQELLAHTEAHFAQEERWMADIGFAPENCHTLQHNQVLHVLREVLRVREQENHAELVATLVEELGKWFVAHAQMMDAALAEVMVERGYDPETGQLRQPLPAEAAPISSCGGGSCG